MAPELRLLRFVCFELYRDIQFLHRALPKNLVFEFVGNLSSVKMRTRAALSLDRHVVEVEPFDDGLHRRLAAQHLAAGAAYQAKCWLKIRVEVKSFRNLLGSSPKRASELTHCLTNH